MSNSNVFSNTADTKTIIRFVKEIERHPCLYDRKSNKYMDRELRRRTWIYIAKKTNSTVADCKDKWTKIRTAYIRTLRPSYNGGVRTFSRPYYLASHLKFIQRAKRHGACRRERCPSASEINQQQVESYEEETNIGEDEESEESEVNLGSQDENSQTEEFLDEDNNDTDNDDNDVDGDANDDDDDDGISGYDNITIDKKETNTVKETTNKTNDKETRNKNVSKSGRTEMPCRGNVDNNPRKMFLFSLLPDIEDLNEQQMRNFRREVIKLIDNVMFN